MRRLVLGIILLFAVACGAPPAPVVVESPTPSSMIAALPEVVAAPDQWVGRDITLIAPILSSDRHILLPHLSVSDGVARPTSDAAQRALWLDGALPPAVASKIKEGVNFLKLRGALSPPGAYGTDARFPYQFSTTSIGILEPERATLAAMADNPRALDGSLLEVEGTLLVSEAGTLMADLVTAGGVPEANADHIKLTGVPDQRVLDDMQQSGDVRFGLVQAVGWWQDGTFKPFMISVISDQ